MCVSVSASECSLAAFACGIPQSACLIKIAKGSNSRSIGSSSGKVLTLREKTLLTQIEKLEISFHLCWLPFACLLPLPVISISVECARIRVFTAPAVNF